MRFPQAAAARQRAESEGCGKGSSSSTLCFAVNHANSCPGPGLITVNDEHDKPRKSASVSRSGSVPKRITFGRACAHFLVVPIVGRCTSRCGHDT